MEEVDIIFSSMQGGMVSFLPTIIVLKKSKTYPSALLSYKSTLEFLKTQEKCHIEKHKVYPSAFRTPRMFLKIPKYLYNSKMHCTRRKFFYFFYKNNVKESMRTQTRDVSRVHFNSIKHVHGVNHVLNGAIMKSNWPIIACAIPWTFYNRGFCGENIIR